jgi:hypothetical protein
VNTTQALFIVLCSSSFIAGGIVGAFVVLVICERRFLKLIRDRVELARSVQNQDAA